MNRDALDEFFAKAEDVLDHWEPSDDAMVARMADEDADLPLADSYYAQGMSHSWAAMWTPIMDMYQRMIGDTMVFGQSFAEARPEGVVRVPVTHWVAFDEAIDWTPTVEPNGLTILQEWADESVTSRREQELHARYSLVEFERYWITEECTQRPAPPVDDVIVPRLSTDVHDSSDPWQWDRKHNTGPRDRRGLDGRFRR